MPMLFFFSVNRILLLPNFMRHGLKLWKKHKLKDKEPNCKTWNNMGNLKFVKEMLSSPSIFPFHSFWPVFLDILFSIQDFILFIFQSLDQKNKRKKLVEKRWKKELLSVHLLTNKNKIFVSIIFFLK